MRMRMVFSNSKTRVSVKGWPTVEQQLGPQDCLSKAEEEKNWWTCSNTSPFVRGWRGGAEAPYWSVRVGPVGFRGRDVPAPASPVPSSGA